MYTPVEGIESRDEFLKNILDEVYNNQYKVVTHREYGKEISYYNIPAAFDIETSSWYNWLDEKCATMYEWTFGINNHITIGRTYEEYINLITLVTRILSLTESLRLVVYVHNLSYEFQFIRKHFKWDKVFFMESRKPIYCLSSGVEYRDNVVLSGKKLALLAQDLLKYPCKKMIGDLDYSLLRHSKTPLTEKELKYCENDVRILLHYIQEKIETDKGIHNIPLTKTGYVRRFCRTSCYGYGRKNYKWLNYRKIVDSLIMKAEEYSLIRSAYQGGFTHASNTKIGKHGIDPYNPEIKYNGIIHKNVASYDFTSSYPAVIIAEKFPMGPAIHYDRLTESELLSLTKSYCLAFTLTFKEGLVAKLETNEFYISLSKIRTESKVKPIAFNGRIFGTEVEFSYDCVDQDYFILKELYDWPEDSLEITNIFAYPKGYLPTNFVKAIVSLYKDKTTLKGITDEIINYAIKKEMLNSAYGMMVTDIIRELIQYIDDEYVTEIPDLEKAIEKYNNNKKRFLFYPWGVWVTAYARSNLFSGIIACGKDYIYSDTDSVKLSNYENHKDYFESYNEEMWNKLERASRYHKISIEDLRPTDIKGKQHPIGMWDFEGVYSEFKTLGAKRYFVKYKNWKPPMSKKFKKIKSKQFKIIKITQKEKSDRNLNILSGQYGLTVAGLGKVPGREYIYKLAKKTKQNPMDLFNFDLYIPSESTGKQCLTYIDTEMTEILEDYLGNQMEVHELSYTHMEEKDYNFNQELQFLEFIMYSEDWW